MPDTRDPSIELPEGYYVDNVDVVIQTVFERYEDLLAVEERALIDAWRATSEPAKRLYVRLVSRKGPLFRRDRLRYPEIPSLDQAVDELVGAGLLDDRAELGDEVTVGNLLALLVRGELMTLLEQFEGRSAPRSSRRGELLDALIEGHAEADLAAAVRRRTGGVLRPLGITALTVIRLLFFGNLHQDWTEFILRDLGVQRWEPYALQRDHRLFDCRRAVEHALLLRTAKRRARQWLHEQQIEPAVEIAEQIIDGLDTWHETSLRHADSILVRVGRQLERQDRLDEAIRLYRFAHRPPARERHCRTLDRLGRSAEALALAGEVLAAPRDETEAAFAPAFAHRMERKLGLTTKPWRRPVRPRQDLVLSKPAAGAVEAATLQALADLGRRGLFAENWLWHSLFGLAFWDIIFAPIAGAFQHPFQTGPLDLHGMDFRRARSELIEQRLAQLRQETDLAGRLSAVYRAKVGTANALVAWHPELEQALATAMSWVSGTVLATVSDRMSRDLRRYRRGLPDLLVESSSSPVGFELLEVKGPGDQLRAEQGAWIDYLNAHGIPAAVLHVTWPSEVP